MNFGDVVLIDFGTPLGSEAGFVRSAVITTSDAFLRLRPSTLFAVPLTSTTRRFPSHVEVEPDDLNGLEVVSFVLAEQMRAVSAERCRPPIGNVGPAVARQLTDVLAMIIGLP